jgi:nitroreductase
MQSSALDAATLEQMISAAMAAPSVYAAQPWRYRLDPDTASLEVYATAGRSPRRADAQGRALYVSVGAALFNLRVAIAHFGWEPVVRLLPDPAEPELLATVQMSGPANDTGAEHRRDLFDAVWRRHSSRFPFAAHRLPSALVNELMRAAHAEGATLTLPDQAETARLLHLTALAEERDADLARRAAGGGRGHRSGRYGPPGPALGPPDATGRHPVRDAAGPRQPARLPATAIEPQPTIAVLSTTRDRHADWLRAGEALEHVLLVATAGSVRSSLLYEALEWPDLRRALHDPRTEPGHVQMLIRLGYVPAAPGTPSGTAGEVFGHNEHDPVRLPPLAASGGR